MRRTRVIPSCDMQQEVNQNKQEHHDFPKEQHHNTGDILKLHPEFLLLKEFRKEQLARSQEQLQLQA